MPLVNVNAPTDEEIQVVASRTWIAALADGTPDAADIIANAIREVMALADERRDNARAKAAFEGMMVGQDPAVVWKNVAERLGNELDAAEMRLEQLESGARTNAWQKLDTAEAFAPDHEGEIRQVLLRGASHDPVIGCVYRRGDGSNYARVPGHHGVEWTEWHPLP